MGKEAPIYEVIRQTLNRADNELSAELLCQIAGVSRSGYYYWIKTEPDRNRREEEDRADFKLILIAYEYYDFVTTGKYPLNIPNPPEPPIYEKKPEDLGKKKESEAEQSAEDKCS